MNKQTFISTLEKSLSKLPQLEKEHILHYYLETIEDHIEDGMREEEAIQSLGSIEDIVQQTMSDRDPILEEKEKSNKAKHVVKWMILVILSPLWMGLLLTAFLLYITLWMFLLSMVCLVLAFILTSILGIWYVIPTMIENSASGFITLGCTFFSIGMVPLCIKGLRLASTWLYQHTPIWLSKISHCIRKVVQ